MHSEYSLLDGACKIEDLAARAAQFGQPALGLTDHGVMNGAIELHNACKKHGVKPIVGCEIYLVDDHRPKQSPASRIERNHLTLLAADDEGYRNLVKLSSSGFLDGYQRGKPSVDMTQMAAHADTHFRIDKHVAAGRTQTTVTRLDEDGRVDLLIGSQTAGYVYIFLNQTPFAGRR